MADCPHTVTRGRAGETGSWCDACGEKVWNVETRPCGGCKHYWRQFDYAGCRKHMMRVSPNMLVTYAIAKGTCFEDADG